MKRRCCALVGVLLTGISGSALAADEHDDATATPRDWSLGVGLGTSGPVLGGAPIAGGPNLAVLAERRLSPSLWLLGGVKGSYARSASDYTTSDVSGTSHTVARAVGGDLGLRFAISEGQPLAVSAFATVGADYFSASSDGYPGYSGFGLRGRFGLALDHQLTLDGLGLRLSTVLANAGYNELHDDAAMYAGAQSAWFAGIALDPTLELRFAF